MIFPIRENHRILSDRCEATSRAGSEVSQVDTPIREILRTLKRALNVPTRGIASEVSRLSSEMNENVYNSPWFVYIAECKDKTLYTGIALDAKKRIKAHNTTNQCRYTRFRKPLKLAYQELCANQNSALKREKQIKDFSRQKKLVLIEKYVNAG